MGKKWVISLLIIIPLLSYIPVISHAQAPYPGYNYNYFKEPVASPQGYIPERVIYGEDLGIGGLNAPKDMFIDKNSDIYILDTGNNRIVILNDRFQVVRIIDKFKSEKGDEALNAPEGIFVDTDGVIYVADTGNGRVVAMGRDGVLSKVIGKPVSDLIRKELKYKPQKVLVDQQSSMYIMAYGVIEGIIILDANGHFIGFYGSNQVQLSLQELVDQFWKRIFTKKQRSQMTSFVPIEYSNFTLDNENFIYAVTSKSQNNTEQIKKLNPQGANILLSNMNSFSGSMYGEQEIRRTVTLGESEAPTWIDETSFVDIAVDDDGFFYGLDSTRGRTYMYDQESNLLFVFGALGEQLGTFKKPAAIGILKNKILVLDTEKNSITVFYATPFGKAVKEAVRLYNDGLFKEAVSLWHEVLKRDTNYEIAYNGMGKALLMSDNYKEAIRNFKLGRSRRGYDEAYTEYRKQFLGRHFREVFISILLIILLIYLYSNRRNIAKLARKKGWFAQ